MTAVDQDVSRSLGQLVASATTELSALVQDVRRAGTGGGALAAAGVLALFSLPVLSFAAAYGIHNLGLGLAWSFLIVGCGFLLIAALLGLFAAARFKRVKPPQKTITSARQTAAVLGSVKPHPRAAGDGGPIVAREPGSRRSGAEV
jgi:hypothetical protein